MKAIKIVIISLFALMILSGCTIYFTPQSDSTDSQSDNQSNTKVDSQSNTESNTKDDTPVNSEHRKYLKEAFNLAGQGMVKDCRLDVNKGYDINSIISEYGKKPDFEDVASNGIAYEHYKSENLVFGVKGRGDVLVEIRSFDPTLHTITRSEVDKVLGKADDIRKLKGQSIFVYKVNGNEFKLIFHLTKADPTIDHISVYSPE